MTKDVRPGVLCPLLIFSPQLFAYIAKSSNFAPSNEIIYKDGTTNTNKIIK